MDIERLCVRRLKSFMDYSNVAVELCASLDGSDSVEMVYEELILTANAMIKRTRLLEESEELQKRIHEAEQQLADQVAKLRDLLREIEAQKNELENALREASEILDKTIGIRERLLKALRIKTR